MSIVRKNYKKLLSLIIIMSFLNSGTNVFGYSFNMLTNEFGENTRLVLNSSETEAPKLINFTFDGERDKTYNLDDIGTVINYTAIFDEPVLYNNGYITFEMGGLENSAKYVSGSGTDTLIFRYIIKADTRDWMDPRWENIDISDISGNKYSGDISQVSEFQNIEVDTERPYVIEFITNNTKNDLTVGDKIEIQAKIREHVIIDENDLPSITMNTGSVGIYKEKIENPQSIIFSYIVKEGDNTKGLDVATITQDKIWDIAGNTMNSNFINKFADQYAIQVDTSPPNISLNIESDDNWTNSKNLLLDVQDSVAPLMVVYCYLDTNIDPIDYWDDDWEKQEYKLVEEWEIGKHIEQIQLSDKSGGYYIHVKAVDYYLQLENIKTFGPFNLDNEDPQITITEIKEDNEVKIIAEDGYSEIKKIEYKWIKKTENKDEEIDNGIVNSGQTIGIPSSIGIYDLQVTATDVAGNSDTQTQEFIVIVEEKGLMIELSPKGNSEVIKNTSVNVTIKDNKKILGEAFYMWSQSDIQPEENNENWIMFYDGLAGGNLYETSIDSPGNLSNKYFLHIKAYNQERDIEFSKTEQGFYFDNKSPTGTIEVTNNYTNQREIDLIISVEDLPSYLGIENNIMMQISIDGGQSWGEWISYTNNYNQVLPTEEKENTIVVRFKDAVGNISHIYDDEGNLLENYYETAIYDITSPEIDTIVKNTEDETEGNVRVTVAFKDNFTKPDDVTITNDGIGDLDVSRIGNTFIFGDNASITFQFEDLAGNTSEGSITVDNIKRELKPNLVYTSGDKTWKNQKDEPWTNKEVTATLTFEGNQNINITNNNGKNHYVFTDEGEFTFEFSDNNGNTGEATAIVTKIDKVAPVADDIEYSHTKPTNSNVIAKLIPSEEVTFSNGETYTFDNNGSYLFEFEDRAGNKGSAMAEVNIIDRVPPSPILIFSSNGSVYNESTITKDDVVVKVVEENDEKFYVLNNNKKKYYTFKENGSFTFNLSDVAGNIVEITARVNTIDKSKPEILVTFSNEELICDNVIAKVEEVNGRAIEVYDYSGKKFLNNEVEFTENGYKWVKIIDNLGNEVYEKIIVNNIDREKPKISFLTGEDLIILKDSEFNPLKDIEINDNLDNINIDDVVVKPSIDTANEGEYLIKYSVSDSAGNMTEAQRKVYIINPSEILAFVNSKVTNEDKIIIYGSNISLKYFGTYGDVTVKWAEGKLKSGQFKRCENYLIDDTLKVDKSGFYSFYIQDQERRLKIIHVYVIY